MKNTMIVMVALLCAMCVVAAPKGEIVYQCNFDDCPIADNVGTNGLPKGWRIQDWADKSVVYGYEKGYGDKGAALKIDVRGLVGGQLQVFSGPWDQWQGSWYKLTFKMKGFDHPGKVSVFPRRYFYPWSILGWPATGGKVQNEWTEYSCVKLAKHDIQRDFGVMIATGDVGCFLIDDIKVEKFAEDPSEKKVANTNPVVKGNLVRQGSFEGEQPMEFILEGNRIPNAIEDNWNERWFERAEGGVVGRHCLKIPRKNYTNRLGKVSVAQGVMRGIPISVAAGKRYRLSAYVKCDKPSVKATLGITSSLGGGGKAVFEKDKPGEWKFVTGLTKPVPENVKTITISPLTTDWGDCYLDGVDLHVVEDEASDKSDYQPAAPYEFALSFRTKDRWAPKICAWGEKLPLKVGVWPSADAPTGVKVPATLKVTDYFGRITEKKLALVAGEEQDLDFDPQANGVLRVELVADDPVQAVRIEKVYARLPVPRKTGVESAFGTHMRLCPGIIDYCAAIGIKWQRLHDCSNVCKMKWANQKEGEYRWGDEQIDYLKAKGFQILALPDYPAEWIKTYSDGGTDASGLKREKRVTYNREAYGKWCEELARHYAGRIDYFEIWNEPYIRYFFGGTPEEFGPIWLEGARGVRRGNPKAKIVGFCTELCSPQFMTPSLSGIPAKEKPEIHSVHYYYPQVPGDGDLSYDKLIENIRTTFGDKWADSGEIWNSEGNYATYCSFYTHRNISKDTNDKAVAFGTRGWAATIAGGISKTFLYTTHNTDSVNVGGLMTLIDYDRSVNPEAAATATTAYLIDGLKPVKGYDTKIKGVKLSPFVGDGRATVLVWDDLLVRGRITLDIAKLGKKYRVLDAMGNLLDGRREVGFMPYFITAEGEDVAALVAELEGAVK